MWPNSHTSMSETTPVELTAGLAGGCYVAQPAGAVLYATAVAAPTDDIDYFEAAGREFFSFTVGGANPPTWCKAARPGLTVTVALAAGAVTEAALREVGGALEVRVSGRTLLTEFRYGQRARDRAEFFEPGSLEVRADATSEPPARRDDRGRLPRRRQFADNGQPRRADAGGRLAGRPAGACAPRPSDRHLAGVLRPPGAQRRRAAGDRAGRGARVRAGGPRQLRDAGRVAPSRRNPRP